jgi:transposase-like protein
MESYPAGWDQGSVGHLNTAKRGSEVLAGRQDELNHRGLKDILVAVIDGLKGFPEAIRIEG